MNNRFIWTQKDLEQIVQFKDTTRSEDVDKEKDKKDNNKEAGP